MNRNIESFPQREMIIYNSIEDELQKKSAAEVQQILNDGFEYGKRQAVAKIQKEFDVNSKGDQLGEVATGAVAGTTALAVGTAVTRRRFIGALGFVGGYLGGDMLYKTKLEKLNQAIIETLKDINALASNLTNNSTTSKDTLLILNTYFRGGSNIQTESGRSPLYAASSEYARKHIYEKFKISMGQ